MKRYLFLSLLLMLCCSNSLAYHEFKLTASDGESEDLFGHATSISDDWAAVGAYGEDSNGENSGAVYFFEKEDSIWIERKKITPADGSQDDFFGRSVALDGKYLFCGAPGDDDVFENAGSVYVYEKTGIDWTFRQEIVPDDAGSNDWFGWSIDVKDRWAVIGSPLNDENGNDSGAVYVYCRLENLWVLNQKIIVQDGEPNDWFGWSTSLDGNFILSGSPYNDNWGNDAGAVYVFSYNGQIWIERQKIVTIDAGPGNYFGWSVSLDLPNALIGAYRDDDNGLESGSAYIYHFNGFAWLMKQKLTAFDGASNDWFGWSVSLDGSNAVIGAFGDDMDSMNDCGSIYVYKEQISSWGFLHKINAIDRQMGDWFGWTVCVSGDSVIVGAEQEDQNGDNSGAAYVYEGYTDPAYESVPALNPTAIFILLLLPALAAWKKFRSVN